MSEEEEDRDPDVLFGDRTKLRGDLKLISGQLARGHFELPDLALEKLGQVMSALALRDPATLKPTEQRSMLSAARILVMMAEHNHAVQKTRLELAYKLLGMDTPLPVKEQQDKSEIRQELLTDPDYLEYLRTKNAD